MAEMTIRRFGIFSVAKMQSLVMFVIGLIVGVLYGLIFMLVGASLSAFGARGEVSPASGVPSIVVGVFLMIGVPIIYAVLGFIGGAIGALVYNLAAGMIGGIKFDLEGVNPQYAPPPPPQQWAPNPYSAR
jgi:hypothetical protein